MISLKDLSDHKEAIKPRVPSCEVEIIPSKILRTPSQLGRPFTNIYFTDDAGYFPVYPQTSPPFPQMWPTK